MALSKLVIGLVAGIASVATIGGITAGVVVSNNRNTVNTVEEDKSRSEELVTNTSMAENRNRRGVGDEKSTGSSKENIQEREDISGSKDKEKRDKKTAPLSSERTGDRSKQMINPSEAQVEDTADSQTQDRQQHTESQVGMGEMTPTPSHTTTDDLQQSGAQGSAAVVPIETAQRTMDGETSLNQTDVQEHKDQAKSKPDTEADPNSAEGGQSAVPATKSNK